MKIRRKKSFKHRLLLFPEHLADLKQSGLSDKTIKEAGIYSVDREGVDRSLPAPAKSAIVFSYERENYRLKLFPPGLSKEGKPMKYYQPPGTSCHIYFPPGVRELIEKNPYLRIYITEGEKKALKAWQEGIVAIAIPGIWSWFTKGEVIQDFDQIKLTERPIVIVPDSDIWEKQSCLMAVYALSKDLEGRGAFVSQIRFSSKQDGSFNGAKVGFDDFLLANTAEKFKKHPVINLDDAVFLGLEDWYAAWRNKSGKRDKKEDSSHTSHISPAVFQTQKWPQHFPLEDFYGLAGDFVRLVDPATEADPIAIYIQLLTFFGNLIGRTAHFIAEEDKHYMNLFAVLVGETSKGRKGSSWSQVKKAFGFLEDSWLKDHLSSGLSSGEGLMWAVRDPIERTEPIRTKGKVTGYQQVKSDPGVTDKRLIVYEPEFAAVLRVLEREGNTLSAQIRQAWESGTLRTLTKNSPVKATDAHISTLGHITRDELRRYLNLTEAASGFGNRFLWFCVKRSKILPEGGSYNMVKMTVLYARLKSAIRFASRVGLMKRDEKAKNYWKKIYTRLSEGKPGMLGAVTARAEAQVMRLSCLFALLDQSSIVKKRHLRAAVKLWDFSYQSAEHIFGHSLGDDVADRIYFELSHKHPAGMSLSEISALFSNHKSKERLHSAIQSLLSLGRIYREETSTGGRKAHIFKIVLK